MTRSSVRPVELASRRAERTGVVLCGGRSRRMGRDKALLELGGRTLLERAVEALDAVCAEVLLAPGSESRYATLGRREVLDAADGVGPLAGLVSALEAARTEWLIALACDMPGVDARVLEELANFAQDGGWDVTMLGSEAGVEPLCAVYRSSCARAARAALTTGRSKLTSFHDEHLPTEAALRVAVRRSEHFPEALRGPAADSARNLNTPEDLVQALRAAEHRAPRP